MGFLKGFLITLKRVNIQINFFSFLTDPISAFTEKRYSSKNCKSCFPEAEICAYGKLT